MHAFRGLGLAAFEAVKPKKPKFQNPKHGAPARSSSFTAVICSQLVRAFGKLGKVGHPPRAKPNRIMNLNDASHPTSPINVTLPGQKLQITLLGFNSHLQRPFYVMTERVDTVNHTISVVTLKGHPLAGWRYWRVYSIGTTVAGQNDVVIETGAYDQPGPGLKNYIGYYLAAGDISRGWAQYVRFFQTALNAPTGANLHSSLGGIRISNVRTDGAFEPQSLVDGYWDYDGSLTQYILANVCQATSCH